MEENSRLLSSSTSNWITIPPELLTMIFDKLAALNIHVSVRRNSILRCREVHPFWKSVMDANLEMRSLEYISKWKPFNYTNKNVYEFPRLEVVLRNSSSAPEWVHLPPQIYNAASSELKPFLLTRSLTIRYADISEWNIREGYVLTKFMSIFSKCGAHLSSLNLNSLTLSTRTLRGILSNTSNLKGITLDWITIADSELWTADLPALAQLEAFRIFKISQYPVERPQLNLYKVLLEPYSHQLVSIEIDISFGSLGLVLPSLKMLTVWCLETGLLERPPSTLPMIQYLSLGELGVLDSNQTCMRNLHNFIFHFAKTLVELHVDVNQYMFNEPIIYDGRFNEKIVGGEVFPQLKKFSIFCPQHMEEWTVVKNMLCMFPRLEALRLLRFGRHSVDFESFSEDDKKSLRSHFINEKYWDVCRQLKSIVVKSGVKKGCAFYTARPTI